jgi:hypothetical protein
MIESRVTDDWTTTFDFAQKPGALDQTYLYIMVMVMN